MNDDVDHVQWTIKRYGHDLFLMYPLYDFMLYTRYVDGKCKTQFASTV